MAEARNQSSRRWVWIGAAIVLIAVFFTARYLFRDRLPVRAAQAERETIVNTVSTNGRVEPEQPYNFYSPIATTVKAVYVHPGDKVPKGKLMIVLDDVAARAQVASAKSAVQAAQVTLDAALHNGTQAERQASAAEIAQDKLTRDQARRDVEALQKLVASGAASPSEVAAAQQRLQSAEAALSAAQTSSQSRYSPDEIARARAALTDAEAGLAAAQHVESQTRIYAPIAGTVYSLDAASSEFAEAGKLLLKMADLDKERVRAYFDEPDLGRLSLGQKADIRWEGKPDQQWTGKITRLPAAVVTYTTRIVGEVMISLDKPDSGLLPDTTVTVRVTISSEPNALTIPHEALHSANGQYFVYKITDGELKRTPVTVGVPSLTQAPILSGLNVGDWVATGTTNGLPLQEDMPVQVQR
jgi:HlyD family secretion protein